MSDPESPPPYDTAPEALERDTDVEFVRASGPGGQHRNRRETGVRIRHRPSGIVIAATERRSQAMNRKVAFERLVDRLDEANEPEKERIPTRKSRGSQERRLASKKRAGAKKAQRRFRPSAQDD